MEKEALLLKHSEGFSFQLLTVFSFLDQLNFAPARLTVEVEARCQTCTPEWLDQSGASSSRVQPAGTSCLRT